MVNFTQDDLNVFEPGEDEIKAARSTIQRNTKIFQKIQEQESQAYRARLEREEFEKAAERYGKTPEQFSAGLSKPVSPEQQQKIEKVMRTRIIQAQMELYRIMTGEDPLPSEVVQNKQGKFTGERRPVPEERQPQSSRQEYGEEAALRRAKELLKGTGFFGE
jgi:hypothetical protein